MTRTALIFASLAALTSIAHGKNPPHTPSNDMVTKLGPQHADKEAEDYDKNGTSSTEALEKGTTPAQCDEAMKDVADDAHVYSTQAFRFKNVQKDDQGSYISGADAKAMCVRYAKFYAHEYAEAAIAAAFLAQSAMKQPMDGQYESEALRVGETGATCMKAIDAAIAAGEPVTATVSSPKYKMPAIALADARTTYCQPAIDFGAKRADDIRAAAKAKHDAIVAAYAKAGIKGKRLELFVEAGPPDDSGFMLAGCERFATLAEMKKAKKLFTWSEGSRGYTVTAYTFRGDDYVEATHEYDFKDQAYRGCR